MILYLQLILLILTLIFHQLESISYVTPISKHTNAANPLYSTQIITKYVNFKPSYTSFLIDIEASFTWLDCILQDPYHAEDGCPGNAICLAPITCEENQCTDVRTSSPQPSCAPVTNSSTLPASGACACPVSVVNPVNESCVESLLNYGELRFHETDGRTWFPGAFSVYPLSACAPWSAFESFPENVTGVVALSSSPHALPASLFYVERSFALCLPNTVSSPGTLFIGNGPYYLHSRLKNKIDIGVESLLSYTPLLTPEASNGYFIGVETIVIKKRTISIRTNATAKISTIAPYTTLRTDIYKQVLRRFSLVTRRLVRLVRVKPVAPFGLCFKLFNNGTNQVGMTVPDIEFGMPGGKNWVISTANSMKRVANRVACLAFVDGGPESEDAIVMGTFQMEDNFVVFDVVNSSFGFSSSLLKKGTSCTSFNFTSI